MKPIGAVIARTLQALGLRDDVVQADAIRSWERVATATLGALGARTRAVRVDGETLVIVTPTSSHSAEIRLREPEILAALSRAAPGSHIRRLRCAPSGDAGVERA